MAWPELIPGFSRNRIGSNFVKQNQYPLTHHLFSELTEVGRDSRRRQAVASAAQVVRNPCYSSEERTDTYTFRTPSGFRDVREHMFPGKVVERRGTIATNGKRNLGDRYCKVVE